MESFYPHFKVILKKCWKDVQKYLEDSKSALELEYTLKFCQLVVPGITIDNHSHSVNSVLMQVKPRLS